MCGRLRRRIRRRIARLQRGGTYGGEPLSFVHSYVYDSNERLCKTLNPESNSALVDYDGAGNIAWSADGVALPSLTCDRGSVTTNEKTNRHYDTLNRVTWVETPGNIADVSTSYFADGSVNTIAAANPGNNPVVTSYAYNNRRLLTGEASQNGATTYYLSYGYNANAHLSTLTYPDGQVVGYAPDALGRTTQVAVAGGQVYANTIGYYPTGAISGFTYGNSIVHAMTPNIRQLPARSFDSYNGTTYLDDSYAYDANGNVDYVTDALPVSATSHTRDMGYDDLDRLIVADSPTQVWGQATYSYDPIDNLRSVDIIGGPVARDYRYNYDGSNRLTDIKNSAGTNVFAFGYDTRGNTTSRNGYTAAFDSANRLNAIPGVQTYRYDGLGRRVQTTDADGKTTFWMYSRSGQVIYSSEARRSQNISYLYLGNTQVATRTVAWGTGLVTVRYQHTDALGSPVVETDASRNITKRNVFSPWGEAWGTTVVDGTGYTGHVMDAGTGLTYMQQRYYDPAIGRFLSVDPVTANSNTGGNFNRYWYANSNPYKFTDPDGRFGVVGFGIGAGIEFVSQMASGSGSFTDRLSQCDMTDIVIAGAVGAVTGGIGGRLAGQAAQGTIKVGQAIAQTAKVGGATSVIGSGAADIANGEGPNAEKMVVSGIVGAASSAGGAKIATSTISAFQSMARSTAPGVSNIASTTANVMRASELTSSGAQAVGQVGVDAGAIVVQKVVEKRVLEQ